MLSSVLNSDLRAIEVNIRRSGQSQAESLELRDCACSHNIG